MQFPIVNPDEFGILPDTSCLADNTAHFHRLSANRIALSTVAYELQNITELGRLKRLEREPSSGAWNAAFFAISILLTAIHAIRFRTKHCWAGGGTAVV